VTLNDGFQQSWRRYFDATADMRDREFSELLNLLEIACGVHCDKGMIDTPANSRANISNRPCS
jgi:hypothetical protein